MKTLRKSNNIKRPLQKVKKKKNEKETWKEKEHTEFWTLTNFYYAIIKWGLFWRKSYFQYWKPYMSQQPNQIKIIKISIICVYEWECELYIIFNSYVPMLHFHECLDFYPWRSTTKYFHITELIQLKKHKFKHKQVVTSWSRKILTRSLPGLFFDTTWHKLPVEKYETFVQWQHFKVKKSLTVYWFCI